MIIARVIVERKRDLLAMCEDTRKDKQRAELRLCKFVAEFMHLTAPFLVLG